MKINNQGNLEFKCQIGITNFIKKTVYYILSNN